MIDVGIVVNVDSMVAKIKKDLESWMARKNDEFLQRLLTEAGEVAKGIFGNAAEITVKKERENTYSLTASGEAVCFIEFGTGVYADSKHPFANEMPFTIAAGSWSDTHARTWQAWKDAGKDPNKYPFNRMPKRGMWQAYKYIKDNATRIAREVYK